MTKERWKELRANVKENFGIEDEYEEDLEPGIAEVIQFTGAEGKTLMRFVTKPKVLDKKTSFSHRAGSDVKVEYVYSEDETSSYLEIYTWSVDKDDWVKLDVEERF
ncbi:MAG: hypothetical protein WCS88_00420 [Patescibacteria group bacterium]|jgi:hypothetical protein